MVASGEVVVASAAATAAAAAASHRVRCARVGARERASYACDCCAAAPVMLTPARCAVDGQLEDYFVNVVPKRDSMWP